MAGGSWSRRGEREARTDARARAGLPGDTFATPGRWRPPEGGRRLGALAIASCALWVAGVLAPTAAAAPSPILYEIDLRQPLSHLVHVRMTVENAPAALQIQFPAWNALYQMRDFVKDVQHLEGACDGAATVLLPVDVNTWRTGPHPCAALVLSYSVYVDQESVFSAVLNDEHAFLNLADVLFYLPAERARAVRVRFALPEGWKLATAFSEPPAAGEYSAPSYDRLVDSPVEAGGFDEYSYTQSGTEYRVVVYSGGAAYPSGKLLDVLRKITASETGMMEDVPFRRYTFIFHFLPSGGGGMEHAYGTAIGFPADQLGANWEELEATIAHEFFHAWNVKRIRPQGLEPVDYVRGNDTRDLWFSEGVTSTVQELTLFRAGLISRRRLYDRLAEQIAALEARPARGTQSAELSGMDAWLEGYPDYHRPERSISYYNKGELLGLLIDLGLRQASGGRASLDELMRTLDREFARRGRFFSDDDLEHLLDRLGGGRFDAAAFFRDDVMGTRELDYGTFLGYAGLVLEQQPEEAAAWGFRTGGGFGGPGRVTSLEPGSNAERAGLRQGDVVTSIDHQPLTSPVERVAGVKPGQTVELEIQRRARRLNLKFQLGSTTVTRYRITENPQASPDKVALRDAWLKAAPPRP